MVNIMIWVILGLLILFGIIAIIVKRKGKKVPTDYYTLFIVGVTWLPFGILIWYFGNVSLGNFFTILGLVYLVMGLVHKKEWKKNHKGWDKLSEKERGFKIWTTIILGIIFLIGIIIYYFVSRGLI
jgi:hypothetical protein